MPTYSYACTSCGHAFDIRQSFSDDALTVCPECTEKALRKVIHPVGIAFKGSGFYKTDSRASGGKGSSATAPASAATGSSDSSASSSSSESTSSTSSSSSATSSSTAAPAAASSSTAS
ncbi:FmdB family transcriptional regulator [Intrasporangium oryzae NRRL B-24470]|uniref:FmdB family transcriptional regulator n=1 Tax=Intrasporangium oryzae NRRL B-24470 TaxID=1386089 RepID=W9GCH0_9MICO|nr:FmdB family zinc ribbon protein [Intrasporangium oryzae]EWT01534.1 FmdB family transcriptional regulator [Intrasporangium oryzae NRRL B-24470]